MTNQYPIWFDLIRFNLFWSDPIQSELIQFLRLPTILTMIQWRTNIQFDLIRFNLFWSNPIQSELIQYLLFFRRVNGFNLETSYNLDYDLMTNQYPIWFDPF